ncbi:MAG: DUF6891 domain-containing protein [Anaerolineales bacterium]
MAGLELGPGIQEQARDFVRRRVREGFSTPKEIIDQGCDYFIDQADLDALEPYLQQAISEELRAHRDAQAGWPEITDCDLLDMAFGVLDHRGIVARQNFSCCQTCGHTEIGAEIERVRKQRPVEGYVFYHEQDTESAAETGALYLAYGAVEEGPATLVEVGQHIVSILQAEGLHVEWDQDPRKRLRVNLDWKRRRTYPGEAK